VALAAAAMAPVLSVVLNTPAAAPAAGAALPLAFALAFVACLFVGNTVVQFARCLPSAGSFYTFNTKGLGQTAGFLTGWLLWLGYGMFAPGMFAALGEFTRNYAATFGLTLPWWVFSVAALALILGMSLRSIKASVQTSLALLALEMAVFLALAGLVVARAGMDNSLTYFTPAAAPTGWGGVGLGMVFGILSFIGFDAAATLGEETRNPRRNVPRAVLLALLVVGLFYVFLAYAVTAGFGLEDPARLKAFADDPDPFLTLAKRNAPWLAHAVDLCAIASIFGCFLAIHNTTVRILFSMGREKVLPRFLGRVHRRWYSPYGAIAVQTVFTLSAGLGLGFWLGPGPTGAYAFAGTAGTIAVILVYGLSNVALVCFYAQRGDLHPFRHGAVPLLGTAALVYPLWASLQEQPDQTYSSLLIYLVVGGWLLLGLVLCGYFRWRAPEKLARVGTFVTEDEESLATSQWHDQEKKRATT
jgi:amino acid transporter